MRNFKIPKLGCIALMLFIAADRDAVAGKEDLATSMNDEVATEGGNQVGIGKFFKLPFHVSVSVRGGYDDNVISQTFNPQGSAFVEANLGVTYAFGNSRTQLSLQSEIAYTDYFENVQGAGFDFHPNLTITATHRVSPRLTLSLNAYLTYQQQPDFTNNFIGVDRRSGSYFFSNDKISAAYQWTPRFSTVTSYTFLGISYQDSGVGAFQNRTEHTLGNEFRFLVLPTTSVIAEYRHEFIAYETATPQTRDSMTQYLLGGLDHTFSPRVSISVRGGVSIREYDTSGDQRLDPYGEGTLNYALGPHLTLVWTASYSLEEPDNFGSPSRTSFRTSLTGRYNVTPRITAALSAFYGHDENDGQISFFFFQPGFAEDILSLSATVRYALNRTWGLELGYEFTDVASDLVFREYSKNRFFGGANFRF